MPTTAPSAARRAHHVQASSSSLSLASNASTTGSVSHPIPIPMPQPQYTRDSYTTSSSSYQHTSSSSYREPHQHHQQHPSVSSTSSGSSTSSVRGHRTMRVSIQEPGYHRSEEREKERREMERERERESQSQAAQTQREAPRERHTSNEHPPPLPPPSGPHPAARGRAQSMSQPQMPSVDILENDPEFDKLLVRFLKIKNQPFAVSGTVPLGEREGMSMFFRSKSGHSTVIDFPVDLDKESCPEFSAFALECRRYSDSSSSSTRNRSTNGDPLPSPPNSLKGRQSTLSLHSPTAQPNEPSLIFPPSQSLTTTFDLSSYPILDAVRDVLFPSLPPGHFLLAKLAVAELTFPTSTHRRVSSREETPANKVATLHLTMPVRFRGGTLLVRHPEDVLGIEEKFPTQFSGARASGGGLALEWTAFLSDCQTTLTPVTKGCKMTLVYNILLQSTQSITPDPIPPVVPNTRFLDAMIPLFKRAKGNGKLGFYLSGEYSGINPVDSVAGVLIPRLKGSDSVLYHAARLYHLKIELRYAGGGYIWPADRTIQLATTSSEASSPLSSGSSIEGDNHSIRGHNANSSGHRRKLSISESEHHNQHRAPVMSKPQHSSSSSSTSSSWSSSSSTLPPDAQNSIKAQVESSGAQHFHAAGISALTAHSRTEQGPVTRLPVPFLCNDTLNRLWVNVLMVIWEP